MGRKVETLEVKIPPVPSFFRCPISLDVMRSPVSLCTGVTYDRASIQRWLDSGNTTCPATMLPLPSTDLVPNLTLQRLINLWSSTSATAAEDIPPAPLVSRHLAADLLRDLRSSTTADPVPALHELADFFASDDVDEFDKNNLINAGGCAAVIVSVLGRRVARMEALQAAIRVLALIITSNFIEDSSKRTAVADLSSDLNGSVSALIRILKSENSLESRIDATRVLDAIVADDDQETRTVVAEEEELIGELIRLIGPTDEKGTTMDRRAVEAGLGCLAKISTVKRIRPRLVQAGVVRALTRVLTANPTVAPAQAGEKALRLMEAVSGFAEGRAAICEDEAAAVAAVVGRMMKVGREGAEAAAAVLWSVCHRFRDRRAVEVVGAAEGGVTKLLLLMQSGCSPAARQMAADLLKIFGVNSKSCLAGYDTKTTHIMPF